MSYHTYNIQKMIPTNDIDTTTIYLKNILLELTITLQDFKILLLAIFYYKF
jgi:hypothetical protein